MRGLPILTADGTRAAEILEAAVLICEGAKVPLWFKNFGKVEVSG